MTDEEIGRFAFVLEECERIRQRMVRDEAALSSGEHDGIPVAPAPPEQRPQTVPGHVPRSGRPVRVSGPASPRTWGAGPTD
jgi:hypothetical protein